METKRIQCPSCGVILDVRNSKNEDIKIITCPQCGSTLRVKFHKHQEANEPLDAETFLPGKPSQQISSGSETKLASPKIKAKSAILVVDGREYKLLQGENTIGRKSPTSSASVQIATSDGYMSRRQAKITVSTTENGALKAVISNDRNKNLTSINGQELSEGDEIVLTDGDEIVMGKTRMTYIEQ